MRCTRLLCLLLAVVCGLTSSDVVAADGASNQKKAVVKMNDADGNGKLNLQEKAGARMTRAQLRIFRGLRRNQGVVNTIR